MLIQRTIKVLAVEIICRAIYYSGALSLIRYINRKKTRILMYHSIGNSDFFMPSEFGLRIPLRRFARQMRYLKKHYNIVTSGIIGGKKLDRIKRKCIITFDDGYKDNYTHAFRVLKHYNIPATVFLITESISDVNWHHLLYYISSKAGEKRVFEYLKKEGYSASSAEDAISKLASAGIAERKKVLSKMQSDFGIVPERNTIYLSEKEINEMKNSGISFGSHSRFHSNFNLLSEKEIEEEIEGMNAFGSIALEGFSYPFAGLNPKIKEKIKGKSKYAMSGGQKLTNLDDLHDLNRIFVTNGSIFRFACQCEGIF